MSSSSVPNDLIFFHYAFSPYARKITWYLALRGIRYAECMQPLMLPRPDLSALGLNYRRIPVLSHAGDIFCDTRLILSHLDAAFPASSDHPSLNPTTTTTLASSDATLSLPTLTSTTPQTPAKASQQTPLSYLLNHWTDTPFFARCAQLIPTTSPVLQNPAFLADRTAFSGRTWSVETQTAGRAEALVAVRSAFEVLENVFLADGRDWLEGGDGRGGPGMADLEGVWPFHWISGIPEALDGGRLDAGNYPRVFAWIARFDAAIKAAVKQTSKPVVLEGADAVSFVLGQHSANSESGAADVDSSDALGLALGDVVEVHPTDSGVSHKDVGRLVKLNVEEVVVAVKVPGGGAGEVQVHFPRWGYKVKKVDGPGEKGRL